MRALGVWYQENNLSLNINKMEMIVDYRKQQGEHPPIHGTVMEKVSS